MDFHLSKRQKAIRNMCRNFAREVVAPRAAQIERTGEHPYEILAQMAELGIMGIPFPEKYGGGDGNWVSMHLGIEELSRADILLGAILDVTTSVVGQELFIFGTEVQKQRWLIPIAQGEELGAYGMTEPDAGSDAAGIRTTAVLKGEEWVINGSKQFITNTGLDNTSIVIMRQLSSARRASVSNSWFSPQRSVGEIRSLLLNCRIPPGAKRRGE